MDKIYKPQTIEKHWNTLWLSNDYFKPKGSADAYCIMLPPPNITGTLHMGHGFQQTLMDALTRYHRMLGKRTLWQGGTDHAGIATQMVVERQLIARGSDRHTLGRDAFIKEIWKWRDHSGAAINQQMQRLGTSIDWDSCRFTMDETLSKATNEAFIRLYEQGMIYRGKKLVNWDPMLQTAISDLEVETVEADGKLWHIRYPLQNNQAYIVVATTRPETMLGDTAVAVHPEDARYQHLIGEKIRLPLCERTIPIIADDSVDQSFGSGCVKITPAHDFNDYDMGQRHNLPLINIFTPEAKLNNHVPAAYRGLDRFDARKRIITDLKSLALIEKIEDHKLSLPKGDRSGAVIEPYLTDQWFLKMKTMAEPAINAVKDGSIKFIPQNWTKTYLQWLENIEDWCLSRQLWWGHRIPVWYDQHGKAYAGESEDAIRQRHNLNSDILLRQDEDVLDTWFTSSLWPFATLGWPEKTVDLKKYYPTQVLVTGFDIIFFWVARMIMMGLKLTSKVPFSEVYVTGLIRDSHGKKMSKSKGNVLDPIDLIDGIELETLVTKRSQGLMQPKMIKQIEKNTRQEFPNGITAYGTDALRFTFCALATTGRDIHFDMRRLEGYRNFCNKLWNAARFAILNTENNDISYDKAITDSIADRWIRCQLQFTLQKVSHYFENYRFDLIAQTLYEFVWHEYCDWYLELAKCLLANDKCTEAEKRGTRLTMLTVLESLLRGLHPIMPFITEEIWQRVAPLVDQTCSSIMLSSFPTIDEKQIDEAADKSIAWLKAIVIKVRTIRSEMNLNPGKKITLILRKGEPKDQQNILQLAQYIKTLAKVSIIHWAEPETILEATASTLLDSLEIHIPLAGLIDKKLELERIKKESAKLEKEINKSAAKLNNPAYISKAPEEIVKRQQELKLQAEKNLSNLQQQLKNIASLPDN